MGKDFIRKDVKSWQTLGPKEQAFLLASLQGTPLPSPLDDLDWPTINRRLRSDGLAPLIYHRLGAQRRQLPDATQQQLQQSYYQNVSVNHIRWQALQELGQKLGEHNIPLLVLKGGALALAVYDDPGLRFMGDLDITVPPHQTELALTVCQQNGYHIHPDDLPDLQNRAWLHQEGWHIRLLKQVRGKQMVVELHWPLRPDVLINQVAHLDLRQAWQTVIPLDSAHNLYQFHPTWQLLHLCIHIGLQHRFTDLGLRQYVDIDLLLRHQLTQNTSFWPDFTRLAQQARAQHVCYFTLTLVQTLLNTPIDAPNLARLAPESSKQTLFNAHFDPASAINRQRVFYDGHRGLWRQVTTDKWYHRLLGPWQQLFPSADYLAYYYDIQHHWQRWFYALWHPFHALTRASRRRALALTSFARRQ